MLGMHSPALNLIAAQALGLAAMAIDVWGTTVKDDRKLTLTVACSSLVFAIHFMLLSATAGAANELVTTVRSAGATYYRKTWIGVAFVCTYVLLGFETIHSFVDVLPSLACILGTVAMYWCRGIHLRLLFAFAQVFWLLYSLHAKSIGGSCLYVILILGTARTAMALLAKRREARA